MIALSWQNRYKPAVLPFFENINTDIATVRHVAYLGTEQAGVKGLAANRG